jgi:hypothetical protein
MVGTWKLFFTDHKVVPFLSNRFSSILTPEIFFTDSSQDGITRERCTVLGIGAVHSLYGANFVLVVPDILW